MSFIRRFTTSGMQIIISHRAYWRTVDTLTEGRIYQLAAEPTPEAMAEGGGVIAAVVCGGIIGPYQWFEDSDDAVDNLAGSTPCENPTLRVSRSIWAVA